jgi:hypothetical protein
MSEIFEKGIPELQYKFWCSLVRVNLIVSKSLILLFHNLFLTFAKIKANRKKGAIER